jgi:hypothetical protein
MRLDCRLLIKVTKPLVIDIVNYAMIRRSKYVSEHRQSNEKDDTSNLSRQKDVLGRYGVKTPPIGKTALTPWVIIAACHN